MASKLQIIISTNHKERNPKQNKFFILNFKNWNLFGIYNLLFDFYFLEIFIRFIRKGSRLILIVFPILILSACSYSFTGSSVPKHLKTISIPYCVDRSGSGEPNMADDFTNTLIDQFISDNSLQVTDKSDADALLDCTITSISDTPTIIEGGENVSARRITINARVVYKDFVMKKTIFDKSFSNYGDYTNDGDVFSKRKEAIKTAIDKLTEDILLGVVSNW
jgi:hypothetical protein